MLCTESASERPNPKDRAALERAIARDEEKLREALSNIEQAVRKRVSIAERIRHDPHRALASVFFCGVVLGMTLLGPKAPG